MSVKQAYKLIVQVNYAVDLTKVGGSCKNWLPALINSFLDRLASYQASKNSNFLNKSELVALITKDLLYFVDFHVSLIGTKYS